MIFHSVIKKESIISLLMMVSDIQTKLIDEIATNIDIIIIFYRTSHGLT